MTPADAKEFRIGNIILKKHKEYVVQGSDIMNMADYPEYGLSFDPILLNEHWLLKAGATHKYGNVFFIGKLKFDINTIGLVRFHYSGKVAYLRYVHQLQNLFHALKGTDLTIKI